MLSAEDALAIANDARPMDVSHIGTDDDPSGLKRGAAVTVTPDDNAEVPVAGTLIAADAKEIVHRTDPMTGDVHVHFPRAGFEIKPA